LADAIRIRAIGQETFLLEATVSDPATAAPLANAIAAEWQSGFQASQRAIAKAVAEQLAPAIARQTTRLADAEAALTAFLRPYRYTLRDPARLPAEAAVQVDELRAAIDSERRALRALQDRVRDAELTAAATAARAAVLPAVKPVKQSSARKLWFPLVGLLSGLVAGLAAAGVRDLLRHCLRDPGESQRLLGLPELGVIPTSQSHPSWESAFRNLLSMLWLSGAGQKRPRVVVLISPRGRAGVSTITCQLGVTLATTNRRVLLVDANLASPYLHRFFSMDNEYGLADVLSEEKPVEEYFFSQLAQETGVPGLYLLPAGSATARPGALAQLERLHDLLVRFRLEFHAVLIDAGAALASPDARLLARMADGAIQVHRAGRTTREQALESLHRLQDDGTAVFGTILNGADVPVA
jgi:Mrp family chromosome partitioning ATPase